MTVAQKSTLGVPRTVILLAVMTIVLLVIFVLSAPRLIAADTLEKFFYVVLLVPALLCAAILFGVLKGSHARVRYKHLGWVIELGGPPALFALIVLGFYMVVPKTETFDLTVRPHGPQEQLIKRGALRLEFGNRSETEPLTDKGEADFKGIAHKFRGATLRVLPEIEGYERRYLDVLVSGDAVDLPLVPSPPPENALRGRLFPVPRSPQTVTVVVEGESETAMPSRRLASASRSTLGCAGLTTEVIEAAAVRLGMRSPGLQAARTISVLFRTTSDGACGCRAVRRTHRSRRKENLMSSKLDFSKELTGRRALVTGGTRGIGAAIAQRLLDAGAKVVVTARSRGEAIPAGATFVAGDVASARRGEGDRRRSAPRPRRSRHPRQQRGRCGPVPGRHHVHPRRGVAGQPCAQPVRRGPPDECGLAGAPRVEGRRDREHLVERGEDALRSVRALLRREGGARHVFARAGAISGRRASE